MFWDKKKKIIRVCNFLILDLSVSQHTIFNIDFSTDAHAELSVSLDKMKSLGLNDPTIKTILIWVEGSKQYSSVAKRPKTPLKLASKDVRIWRGKYKARRVVCGVQGDQSVSMSILSAVYHNNIHLYCWCKIELERNEHSINFWRVYL